MIIKQAELEIVCGVTSKLPENDKPEIAFAGRSNVGKSSLINGLMNRRRLAKTSSTPGKTQTLNFYKINHAFYFVDLPGYGYAKANEHVKAQWGEMIERYLFTSTRLIALFLLIDIRHDPTKNDRMMYDFIVNSGYTPIIIATKLDKIKRSQIDKKLKTIRQVLNNPRLEIFPYSATTKQGREAIYERIDRLLEDRTCE